MPLIKYSDFGKHDVEPVIKIKKEPVEEVSLVENIEETPETPETSETAIEETVEHIKEDMLSEPKDDISIEILEEKIIKFNNIKLNEILETLKSKYSDTNYYIRKMDKQLHVVKYNESIDLNLNEFVDSIFKFYSSKPELKQIVEGIKVKGNKNFSIIENMKLKYNQKFVDDITKLLVKNK